VLLLLSTFVFWQRAAGLGPILFASLASFAPHLKAHSLVHDGVAAKKRFKYDYNSLRLRNN